VITKPKRNEVVGETKPLISFDIWGTSMASQNKKFMFLSSLIQENVVWILKSKS